MPDNLDALLDRAKAIRQDILRMTTEAGSGHPSSSLSATEVVTALYFGGFLKHDPKNPHWPDRDRFILSKGHAAPVLYAALAQAGYFPSRRDHDLAEARQPARGTSQHEAAGGRRGVDRIARPGPFDRDRSRPGRSRRQEKLSHLRLDRRRRARRGPELGSRRRGRQI